MKLGDFGLAREDVDVLESYSDEPMTPLTELNYPLAETGVRGSRVLTSGVGTSTYASPEQLEGRPYDSKVSNPWLCKS